MILTSSSSLNGVLAQILGGPQRSGAARPMHTGTLALTPGTASPTGLQNAVVEALQQIGVGGSTQLGSAAGAATSGASAASSSSSAALESFVQSLYAALLPQNGSGFPLPGHGQHAGQRAGAGVGAGVGVGVGGAGQRLQSLIQQLQAPGGAAGASASGSSTLGTLQQSFNSLVSALGAPAGSSAGFGSFLNTLATDLAARGTTGRLVSTTA